MKILKIHIILLFLALNVGLAQNKVNVSGKVIDNETSEPISFAQVALYAQGNESKPVAGTTTQANGNFELAAASGKYDLAVVFVGYEKKVIEEIELQSSNRNIGNISLVSATTQLEEIVVQGEQSDRPISTDIEGMTVRPDQMLSNVGGSLLDVLRNVPSISVSQDGTISIRGSSSTNVLIDGRNSVLAADLEQLPASAIENIKIINNPNAKYDAEGTGGVINIQLKKGENTGTSGQAEATLGTRGRFNSSLRLSRRTEKFNVYGGYSYRSWPRVGNSMTIRETYDDNEKLSQDNHSKRKDSEHTFNFGGDYFLGKNKFSYEGAANFEKERDEEVRSTKITDLDTEELLLQYSRENIETEDNLSLDNAIFYERLFDDENKELRAVVSHSFRDQLEKQNINSYSGVLTPQEGEITGRERSVNDEYRKTTIIQLDYSQPLFEGKMETGYKSTFRSFDNDYTYEVLRDNEWVNQENVSNRFLYQDQIHAAYVIFTRTVGKFDLSAGTRAEQTFVDTELYNTGETNEQSYLNFFPSFQALYNLNDDNGIKFTYSRRIDRPNGWRLNPFPDIADSLNIRSGNPDLQPEMIHSLELGHLVTFNDDADITTNLFFRHVDGQVDYIVDVRDGVSYRMPTNLNTSKTYGLEIIGSATLTPWWNANGSYSIFRAEVDGSNLGAEFTNEGYSWNAKLTTDFTLPYDIGLQLTGNYEAPEIEAQGRDFARYHMDASMKKSILNDRGSINLTLRDVFNTRNFSGENYSSQFYQEFEWKRESRIFLASLSYKI